MVQARVERRIQALRLGNIQKYLNYLIRDPHGSEVEHLLNAVSTNLTHFYRDQAQYSVLHDVLEQWMSEGQTKFRLWSAACSTGQEAYSMAMTLLDCAGKKKMDWKIFLPVCKYCVNLVYQKETEIIFYTTWGFCQEG
mgnify:CR=1 FL=1